MCGRYLLTLDFDTMMDLLNGRFELPSSFNIDYRPRYNIAPTQQVLTVLNAGTHQRAGYMKWGFLPPWAKAEDSSKGMINARSETAAEKKTFSKAFHQSRCLILANGFYEWKKVGSRKVPMLIKLKDNQLFTMAGLYTVHHPTPDTKIGTCTILTTSPNKLMENIHHRMPVILHKEVEQTWLDLDTPNSTLNELFEPYDADAMTAYAVNPVVNSVKNDSPDCIQKVTTFENTSLDLI